jgi:hypothetical protein
MSDSPEKVLAWGEYKLAAWREARLRTAARKIPCDAREWEAWKSFLIDWGPALLKLGRLALNDRDAPCLAETADFLLTELAIQEELARSITSAYAATADQMFAAQSERDLLHDALVFYADPRTYQTNGHPQIDADLMPIKQDWGKQARETLARIAGCGLAGQDAERHALRTAIEDKNPEGRGDPAAAAQALDLLDAMAETWAERKGIAQALRDFPVNCQSREHQDRARELILAHVKIAYAEGLYAGRISQQPVGADEKTGEA